MDPVARPTSKAAARRALRQLEAFSEAVSSGGSLLTPFRGAPYLSALRPGSGALAGSLRGSGGVHGGPAMVGKGGGGGSVGPAFTAR